MKKVAVIIGDSLLAEGMFSYLQQHAVDVEFKPIDILSQNAFDQISEFQPDIVILEESSSQNLGIYLFNMLKALPNLLIICLYLQDHRVRLIQSEQLESSETNEIINIIKHSHLHQIQPKDSIPLNIATIG
jgi:hypothetical protein